MLLPFVLLLALIFTRWTAEAKHDGALAVNHLPDDGAWIIAQQPVDGNYIIALKDRSPLL